MKFANRREAGRVLGAALSGYTGRPDVVVLALPRGGVPVGYEIARALGAPMDVFIVRRIAAPGEEYLSIGTVATGGAVVVDDEMVRSLGIGERQLKRAIQREVREMRRREHEYRATNRRFDVEGRTVILVDDGLSEPGAMRAAARALRRLEPARIIAAVPVASRSALDEIGREVNDVVCLASPAPFHSVSVWYSDFSQIEENVARSLVEASAECAEHATAGGRTP